MDRIYKIKGVVQHYSWGGTNFIPQLVGINNPDQKPFGEYWLGAHPNAPALLQDKKLSLHQFISDQPAETLGEEVAKKFGSLPYLFKILDVKQMLSIQVHPSKSAAEEEYEKENEKGVPLNAPQRNYKDKNHKPELMVALSDFWLLHGFKKEEEVAHVLKETPELSSLLPVFNNGDYKSLYEEVMTMPQERVDQILTPLLRRIISAYQNNELSKSSEDFWAARAALTFCKDDHYDRGIFSVYLFNLLHLKEGEAIYQPAGLPHAYLEGQNVEVMANSDNVLRAGLTEKHVDVPELMKHVKFEATDPRVIKANHQNEQQFDAPVEEFLLTKYDAATAIHLHPTSAAILFVYNGNGRIAASEKNIDIKRGEAVLLLPASAVTVDPSGARMTLFCVSTPADKN
jgi:mannose-6-phosphate isomerase